ncbi:MAG: aminoglycoside phosphotransferase family protein [Ruminococcaceae bacterium]|nr:aminoglycoside phosphotransferase family protein [Oscillospiraceae bacterium]
MEVLHKSVLDNFRLDAEPTSCERYGCGHINETYLVVTATGHRYILQKINNHIFKDVPALMQNIASVTEYLRKSQSDPRRVLTLVYTTEGNAFLHHADDTYWRVYEFVEDSLCLQAPENAMDFYQSAVAFGTFQQQLKDFPAATLHETIANFHNTPDRYRIFHEVLEADVMGRAAEVRDEIAFVLAREKEAGTLVAMQKAGQLPLRVTHNDTKLNNVMLDAAERTPLCVIDLDTVMPGLSSYDFGDSIRFGAATAAEDEKDLSKVTMSLELFRTFTRGFLKACPGLTEQEKKMLPMGAKTMTLECGLRFLTDYLDGDHYFAVHREGHNLDRCRTQFKLVADMESKWEEMARIVEEEQAN